MIRVDVTFSILVTFSTSMLYFLLWCCISYFNVAFSTLMLHFLPWCCTFYIDIAFSILMLHFLLWCCIFYLDIAFSILILHFLSWWHFLPWCNIFYADGIFLIKRDKILHELKKFFIKIELLHQNGWKCCIEVENATWKLKMRHQGRVTYDQVHNVVKVEKIVKVYKL